MALFVNREQQRTQYQEKLAADLKGKLKTQQITADEVEPTILEDAHQTRPIGMVIAVLLLLVFVITVVVIFRIG